ncbi:MFS transporter [Staphylococcus hominis]|uniref:MFS transporter n=1 Tax=Staphylococcus hominis TaxID=1290 RepID=UPI000D1E4E1E|nr:MFS transporter [Staphylococcus hominis]MCE4950042.1 MFS transporter [Staphylococcus hominis]MCE4952377.1 MFS transporter [Staphylococcus hominis]MCE4974724.1 MFS transporter [Staphylococcus hominis]MDT4036741.1 MFS transporter [Staphylococcus hominis]PTK22891.1 MFS transporter [Staphylococcus hominis]
MNKSSFRFLWLGQSLANSGDVFYMVGLIAIIYELTGSVTYMAFVPFFITTSRFLSGLVAPLIIERVKLKSLLAYSQLGKTVAIIILTGYIEFFSSFNASFLIFLFVIIISFLDGWANPARNALIPILVEQDALVKANSFLAILDQTIRLGGWVVGGMLVAIMGGTNVIWLTFILFVASTIMMFLIPNIDGNIVSDEQTKKSSNWEVLKKGWVTIWQTPTLRTISIVEFFESIANVVWVAAIMYVYVDQVLQTGEQWWGYINATFFAGLMIGGFLSLKWSHLVDRLSSKVIVVGAILASLTTLMFGLTSTPWMALVLSLLFGIVNQIKDVAQETLVQRSVVHRLLPNIYSAKDALITAIFGISSLILGNFTDLFGVRYTFILAATLLFFSAIFVMINRNKIIQPNL